MDQWYDDVFLSYFEIYALIRLVKSQSDPRDCDLTNALKTLEEAVRGVDELFASKLEESPQGAQS
jgi:hypothetical protein